MNATDLQRRIILHAAVGQSADYERGVLDALLTGAAPADSRCAAALWNRCIALRNVHAAFRTGDQRSFELWGHTLFAIDHVLSVSGFLVALSHSQERAVRA